MAANKRRLSAAFICAALIAITLFSALFIVKESRHDCTGEDCPVCVCLHQAEQTLRQISAGPAEAAGEFAIYFVLVTLSAYLSLSVPVVSLISQKVRMNN